MSTKLNSKRYSPQACHRKTGTDVFYVLCQPHVVAKGTTHRHATGTGTGMPYFILEYRRHRYRYTHACHRNRKRYRNRTYDYYVVT